MSEKSEFELEIAQLMVEVLNLDVSHDEIEPESPLFEEGLGLDSIDMLELSMEIKKKYGIEISSSDDNQKIFSSLRSLSKFISENKN